MQNGQLREQHGHSDPPSEYSSRSPSPVSTLLSQAQPNVANVRNEEQDRIPSQSIARAASESDDEEHDRDNVESKPPLQSRRIKESWFLAWRWELFAAIFSISCMAAVVVILAIVQDKPLSHWTFQIQPNSMVSVFSTLSNFALLLGVAEGLGQLKWLYFQKKRHRLFDLQVFDDASRGPLGSLRLLWMLKLQITLASVGAIVTIVSLAMDPFTQQVLSYDVVTINTTNSSVSLPAAKAYNYNLSDALVSPALNYDVLAGMTTATFVAMFSTSNKVSFNCPVGNCTWPEFTTAAICNTCTNQTGLLSSNCTGAESGMQNCTYSFSDGSSVGAYASLIPGPEMTSPQQSTVMNVTVSYTQEGFGPSIGNISYIEFPEFVQDLRRSIPLAYSCEMAWCQKTFSSSKTLEGVLEDDPTKLSRLTFLPCSPLAGTTPGELGIQMCPGFPSDQSLPHWPQYNQSTLDDPSAIWIGEETGTDVVDWLSGMLTLSLSTVDLGNSNREVLNDVVAKMLHQVNGDDNVTSTFDKIATALTNVIRQGPNTTSITGQAQALDVYVRVRWAWLSLPLMMVVFGVLFLAISIMFSSRPGRHVWKSSTLATIFHRLDGWTPDELDQRTEKDMKTAAMEMQVIIDTDANGRISLIRYHSA